MHKCGEGDVMREGERWRLEGDRYNIIDVGSRRCDIYIHVGVKEIRRMR